VTDGDIRQKGTVVVPQGALRGPSLWATICIYGSTCNLLCYKSQI